ncbi:MAG: TonB-dependent receptor [Fibrobacterota bacterium]|nr:TonB-dependent receptor [Fibrobacterota bacterium]
MSFLKFVRFLTLFLFQWSAPASAQDPDTSAIQLPEVTARGARPFTAASSQTIRDRDFALRVMLKPTDLIKVTPGLFTGQHAGGGKANQYFLRGFDIDHGTDLALWVDGMPVNSVSHGHGQGYADLHFIIPELFDRVEVNKGPYFAEYGDFATAGAVRMRTKERIRESSAELSAGQFNSYRFLGIYAGRDTVHQPVLAAEVYRDDGPFTNPEDLSRFKLFFRSGLVKTSTSDLTLTLMSYGSDWNGSGQVPMREVEAGRLDRFGSIDPSEGGNSQRHSASMALRSVPDDRSEFTASAYLINYRLSLYSNFTFFAADPVNGDQIEQTDSRTISGFNVAYRTQRSALGLEWTTLVGLDMRNDLIENALGTSKERQSLGRIVDADIRESGMGLYAQEEVSPLKWLRLVGGIRADYFGFDVSDRLQSPSDTAPSFSGTTTSGARSASIFSPKANAIIGPFLRTELYLNYGQGFHSNDARGVVKRPGGVTPLTKAIGYEIGLRNDLIPRVDLAASLWKLDLESELVWVGDEGVTEARGPTERFGVDAEARVKILTWLWADADLTLSQATYTENAGNANAVALAPTATFAGGFSGRHSSGLKGSLRVQHIADRPATEDESLTAEGFTVVNLGLGWRWKNVEANLSLANLFDVEWREAQFANESRLPGESEPVADIHFVPGAPFQAQGGIRVYF